ncbi:MAG: LysR family transcriptional regulator [Gammaproteobacteria bacterium]|nr:LysR family transcriptional regulator [Gammaproteobacteria bacterium]
MPLEVRQMRHVLALADHRSFARAATALGLSQSALSRSIQSVERVVGSSLFARATSGIEPTDSGRVFIARIRQIVQLTEDLDRDVAGERGLLHGHLHVGAGPFPAQSSLAEALAQFVAAHPRIVVRVMMREWDELLRRLRAREIELFVAEISTFGSESDLEIEPLEPRQTLILARRGHPLAGRGPLRLADGLAYPYASLSRIPPRSLEPIRSAQRRSPDTNAAQRVFPALEFNSLDAVKKIVLGSNALMVAPPSCVEQELEDGRLLALGSEPFLNTHYGIVKLRTQPLTVAGARFREYVLEAERAVNEREKALLERWRPRPAAHAPTHAPARSPGTMRRKPALRA